MNPVSAEADGAAILYDADGLGKIDARFFEPTHWQQQGALTGVARGRGTTWFVRHGEHELVLRHYRRGGMVGPWLGDRYLWLGLARTRAYREWHLLAELSRRGLPVPRPVAARVVRHGWYYRADLITQRIPATESLAQQLQRAPLTEAGWRALGQCLRRFHADGVWHADLNAHNILLGTTGIYLIDFDRGRLRTPGSWARANLARLQRSLAKLAGADATFYYDRTGWDALLAGYEPSASPGRSSSSATR
jgi:3-deoxy-D-manno-octulosonic acid kinase